MRFNLILSNFLVFKFVKIFFKYYFFIFERVQILQFKFYYVLHVKILESLFLHQFDTILSLKKQSISEDI